MSQLFIVLLLGLAAWVLVSRLLSPSPPIGTRSAPTIEQLKPLAELMTHRVVVVDAVTVAIAGYTGDMKAAVVVRGDALITVDLTQARIDILDRDAGTAVIVLPSPRVVSARVDHEQTKLFSIESSGLWAWVPGDGGRAELVDLAMKQAQQAVQKAANEPEVIEQARTRAESLVCSFFASSMDWSVTVCWADKPGAR